MTTIKEKILAIIDAAHEADTLRGIQSQRERLLNDLLSRKRYEERKGKITNEHGAEADLERDVNLVIDAASYVARASDAATKARFISKWDKPDADTRKKIAQEVEKVLETLVKLHAIVPNDKAAFARALDVLSKNFVYEVTDSADPKEKVMFAKINDSGLIGSERYTFKAITDQIAHLIDNQRSFIAEDLRKHELADLAKKILGTEKPKQEYLAAKIEELKRHEIIEMIPARRLPNIPRSEIEREVVRREAIIRGLDPDPGKLVGTPLSQLQRIAKTEYEGLSDTTAIQKQLTEIQPAGPATYEGISYTY